MPVTTARPKRTKIIWILAGILAGLLFDQVRHLPWVDWTQRYGPSVARWKFEEDLRNHRPGTDDSRRLFIYAEQLRDLDGKVNPVHIVVSTRVDHYEYHKGEPTPVWQKVCYVASVPYVSLASKQSYATVMAFLDDPRSGAGGGAVPYRMAWWAKAPLSTLLSAVFGALFIGILWPLAIRRAKEVGPLLSRFFMSGLTRLRLHAPKSKVVSPLPAAHFTGKEAFVEPPAPDLESLQAMTDALEGSLTNDALTAPAEPALAAALPIAELIGDAVKPHTALTTADEAAFGADSGDFYPTVVHVHPDQPTLPPKHSTPGNRRGFAIGDLVIAVGILGILIALMTPLIGSVRARAAQINCSNTLRTMGIAAQAHAAQHQGYLPLCGRHWRSSLWNEEMTPSGLEDTDAAHYVYYTDTGSLRPAPVTAALAVSLGMAVDRTNRAALAADLRSERLRNLFQCPAQDVPGRGYTVASEGWEAPDEFSGYVYNEALLSHRINRPNLPQGQPSRVRLPAQVFFAMDGDPRERFFHIWELNRSFASVLDFRDKEGKCIDYTRHACRANVLFVDWHVADVPLTPAGLQSIIIAELPIRFSSPVLTMPNQRRVNP